MSTKTKKPKTRKKETAAEIAARNDVFVSPVKMKRTIIRDKKTGRLVDVTPDRIKKLLGPKRKPTPGIPMIAPPGNYPMISDATSVNPKQVKQLNDFLEKKGLPRAAQKDGTIRFESAAERKKICEARGFGDRNGGYSDPRMGLRKN
jgi:hypothetical protein